MDPRIENLKSTTFFGDLRASGLVHAERRLPGAGLPSDAGAVGGAGHPEASGEAGIDAPGSAEAAGGARVRGAGGGDRVRAGGVGAAFAAVGDGSGGHRGLEWVGRSASLPWLPTAVRAPLAVLPAGRAGPPAGLPSVHGRRDATALPGRVDRLGGAGEAPGMGGL